MSPFAAEPMDRDRSLRSRAGLLTCSLLLGCGSSCAGAIEGAGSRDEPEPVTLSRTLHIVNEAQGIDDQPDYEAPARELARGVAGRLPDPLPKADVACDRMLAAVRRYYVELEGATSATIDYLDATRADDRRACLEHTPPAVAMCVVLTIAEQPGDYPWDYPWVLDQCDRAFSSHSS